MMDRTLTTSDFLSAWDSLAHPKTCLDLKSAWNRIRNRAEEIDPKGLNELWDFYLERLTECERSV
jgi:hypothetical protein